MTSDYTSIRRLLDRTLACCAAGVLSALQLFAQDAPKPADNPLELPIVVIEGAEKINVPGGIKKIPSIEVRLLPNELNALNSLEKHPPSLLPAQPLPTLQPVGTAYNGFVRGQLGMYITPDIQAGYRTAFSGFDIYARGGIELSDGHVDNAAYSKGFAQISAGYLAPEKYWLFGGSKTDSYFRYAGRSYNLYADSLAPVRSIREFDLGFTVRGTYEGFGYSAGAGIDNMVMTQSRDVSHSSLFGYVAVNQLWSGLRVGGRLALNFRTLRGTGYNFIEAAATGEYLSGPLLLAADVGVQTGANTADAAQVAPLLQGRAELRIDKNLTLRGRLGVGLQDRSYRSFLQQNPYLDDSSDVRYASVLPEISGQILYHPSVHLLLSGGVTMRMVQNMPLFLSTGRSTFRLDYMDASVLEASGEAMIAIDSSNRLAGSLVLRSAALSDSSGSVPYIAPIELGAEYERRWTQEFSTTVGLQYTGSRYADLNETVELDGYLNAHIAASYTLSDRLSVFARIENLTASHIYIWEGYRERGMFGSAGLTWKF